MSTKDAFKKLRDKTVKAKAEKKFNKKTAGGALTDTARKRIKKGESLATKGIPTKKTAKGLMRLSASEKKMVESLRNRKSKPSLKRRTSK